MEAFARFKKCKDGLYYDRHDVHQVQMGALAIDSQIMIGHRQDFSVELDDEEV